MKKWIRRIVLAVVLVAAAAAIYLALRPRPVGVDIAEISVGDLRITVDELGKTRVKDRYVLSAPLGGQLARIELRPGDTVAADAVLARILPAESPLYDARTRAELQTRVSIARAALAQAQATSERAAAAEAFALRQLEEMRKLAGQQAISAHERELAELEASSRTKERESAQFAVRAQAHQLSLAETSAARSAPGRGSGAGEELVIVAPLAGQVLRVIQTSAGVVAPGTPLLEVGDPRALEIVVDVLTSDAVNIAAGMPVSIENWGGPPLSARVRRVEPSAFTKISALGVEEQRVTVLVDPLPTATSQEPSAAGATRAGGASAGAPRSGPAPSPGGAPNAGPAPSPGSAPAAGSAQGSASTGWAQLGDGWRVEARIEIAARTAVPLVPISALVYDRGRTVVYVVRDGKAHLVPVTLGQRGTRFAEIINGLRVGEQVVVHPSDRVVDGAAVTVRGS